MWNVPEFIDTYSDDLLYLMEFRRSHISHPGIRPVPFLHEPCFARIFCVFMIGSLEAMLEHWKDKDVHNILAPYFGNGSNQDRITALSLSFKAHGIEAEETILKKFLAIKYLRNTIIHSNWKENHQAYISEMGFPTDTRQLNESHLETMYMVNNRMMFYIGAVEIPSLAHWPTNNTLPEVKRIFTKNDLVGYLWINLERRYEQQSNEPLTNQIVEDTLFDWNLYKEIAMKDVIRFEIIDSHIAILEPIVLAKQYSKVPIGFLELEMVKTWSDEVRQKLLPNLAEMMNQSETVVIPLLEALASAESCYKVMANYTVSTLLNKLANFKEIINNTNVRSEANLASKLFKLGRLYYRYAEQLDN